VKSAVVWRRDGDVEAVEPPTAEIETRDGEIRAVVVDGGRVPVRVAVEGDAIHVWCAGDVWEFARASPGGPRSRTGRDDAGLRAPMPGRIVRLLVAEGDEVGRGATLLILEAMKMEHEIKAPHDGRVVRLPYRVGDRVDAGAPLVEFAG
jgi:3-methylcrotonyl-CoA carboxylase alpha subunit